MPYTIAGQTYRTKKDVTTRCQAILASTPNGALVALDDTAFLLDLFSHHTEWPTKRGPGISGITTMTTDHGTRCFRLYRVDGDIIDISFTHAVKHLPTTRAKDLMPQPLIDFKNGARMAVKNQIEEFRIAHPPLPGSEASHVDHVYPRTFDALLWGFCVESWWMNPLAVEVIEVNQCVHHIVDDYIREKWQEYHAKHAVLALVPQSENLSAQKVKIRWERFLEPNEDGRLSFVDPDAYTRSCPVCGAAYQVDEHDELTGCWTPDKWEGPCCYTPTEKEAEDHKERLREFDVRWMGQPA